MGRGRYKTNHAQKRHQKYLRRQREGLLNRHNFAYARRDTFNQAMKGFGILAPNLINQVSKEVDHVAEARIRQWQSAVAVNKLKKSHQKLSEEQSRMCTKHHSECSEILARKGLDKSKGKFWTRSNVNNNVFDKQNLSRLCWKVRRQNKAVNQFWKWGEMHLSNIESILGKSKHYFRQNCSEEALRNEKMDRERAKL